MAGVVVITLIFFVIFKDDISEFIRDSDYFKADISKGTIEFGRQLLQVEKEHKLSSSEKIVDFSVGSFEFSNKSDKKSSGFVSLENTKLLDARLKNLYKRINNSSEYFENAKILWVDDKHPNRNQRERWLLGVYGVGITIVNSNIDAYTKLSKLKYDLVVSDNYRENGDESAPCFDGVKNRSGPGCALSQHIHNENEEIPVVLYVRNYKPEWGTPKYVLGMTNKSIQLFNFIVDALQRRQIS